MGRSHPDIVCWKLISEPTVKGEISIGLHCICEPSVRVLHCICKPSIRAFGVSGCSVQGSY